jgi:hypothetical protein
LISVTSASVANIWTSIGGRDVALGDRDRAAEQEDRERAAGERRGVQADPGLGLQRVGVAGDQVQHPAASVAASASWARLNDELDRLQPADQAPDDAGADQRADHERVAGGEHEPEHERQVREREGVRAAAEADVDHADLGEREPERDRPPRQVRLGVRPVAVV